MKQLRLGVIGCGEIAEIHIPNLFAIVECKLIAVADVDNERLQFVGNKFNIREGSRYDRSELLYARQDVDAVLVLTPVDTHKGMVLQAIEAGKHVFVEKPMALNTGECQEMIEAARRGMVKLAVGHYYGFLPTHQQLRKMIRQGSIGRVIAAQIQAETVLIKPEVGQLLDLSPHFVDLLRWYFDDSQVQTVFASISKIAGGAETQETEAYIILKFANGVTGTISLFWTPEWKSWEPGERFIRIIGTHGKLRAGLTRSTMSIYNAKSLVGRVRGTYDIIPRFASHPVIPITGTSFRKEVEDFIEAVQNDREPLISGEVGLEVMKIVDAARLSAQTGRIVEVER